MPDNKTNRQLQLFNAAPADDISDVSLLVTHLENQWFERKSSRVGADKLAECLIGFANADGGRVVIGISNGRVEGTNAHAQRLNDLVQAGRDFASPPVRNQVRYFDCLNANGNPDTVLLIDVEASEAIHRTPKGKCFLRVGDETRELGKTEERELAFDKHEATFDTSPVADFDRDDLDLAQVADYARRMGSTDVNALMRSRGIYRDRGSRPGVTQAGRLVFGLDTPVWSYVRYLRYDGSTAETGVRSNLLEDIRLEGTIPALIEKAQALLRQQVGTVIRLTATGKFARVPALPEFAWLEAVVNALTHRSYSLQGDGIYVRQFSDRLEVQSPGRLPGLVRVQDIQNARFSRNPHIARILAEMTDYVRELNEGVRRMFQEMKGMNLRDPEYRVTDAHVTVVLYKQVEAAAPPGVTNAAPLSEIFELEITRADEAGMSYLPQLLALFRQHGSRSTGDVATVLAVSHRTARNYLAVLVRHGLLRHEAKSRTDPHARWLALDGGGWSEWLDYLRPAEPETSGPAAST